MHVCIATYKPSVEIVEMLRSLAECDLPQELETVWLIENGARAPGLHVPASLSDLLPLKRKALADAGVARSRQWLVEELDSGLIVFLDDDISVDRRLLSSYSEVVDIYGRGHFFGGAVRVARNRAPPSWLLPHLPASIQGWEPSIADFEKIPNPWFLGANFCAFAEDIIDAGGFDLRFGPGASTPGTDANPTGHEMIMQRRLTAIGCAPIYVPAAIVTHRVSANCYTEQWVLHRRYRNALTEGILYGDRHPRGVPRWMWRKLLSLWVRAQIARTSRDPASRLACLSELSHWKGFLSGIRASHQKSRSSTAVTVSTCC